MGGTSLPAIEPYAPGFVGAFAGGRSERAVLLFESPKEECVVRVAVPVYADVASKAAGERPGDARQRVRDLKVCARECYVRRSV